MTYYRNNAQEIKYRNDIMNVIRKDKLDFVMPKAMKDNDMDMLIHVIKRGDRDPFTLDFGADMGYIIFSYKANDTVERAIFGNSFAQIADESIYDVIGSEGDIKEYVGSKNPVNIGVNMSTWLSHCDGLSYTGYKKLCKLIGEEYAEKLVSSERVLTDFRVNRVSSEIIAFAQACKIQNQVMEESFRKIIPGKTSLEEMSLYTYGLLLDYGIEPDYQGLPLPAIQFSDSDESEWEDPKYIFRPGDLFFWDWGIKYLNFGTDFKRKAYILRAGEYKLPQIFKRVWDSAREVRDILRKNMKSGETAKDTLNFLVKKVSEAGYIHTPYTDTEEDEKIVQVLGNSEKIGFSIDCHCVGNTGNSEVAVGPSMAPFRKDRENMIINENNLIAFEFSLHYWHPEVGKRLEMNFEENSLVTKRGIETLYPGIEEILLL